MCMYLCLYLHLFACTSVCLSVCTSVCTSIYLLVPQSVCLCLSDCLYLRLFVCTAICLCVPLSVCTSVCLPVPPFLCLYLLSVSLSLLNLFVCSFCLYAVAVLLCSVPERDEELGHLVAAAAARGHERCFVEAVSNVHRETLTER